MEAMPKGRKGLREKSREKMKNGRWLARTEGLQGNSKVKAGRKGEGRHNKKRAEKT